MLGPPDSTFGSTPGGLPSKIARVIGDLAIYDWVPSAPPFSCLRRESPRISSPRSFRSTDLIAASSSNADCFAARGRVVSSAFSIRRPPRSKRDLATARRSWLSSSSFKLLSPAQSSSGKSVKSVKTAGWVRPDCACQSFAFSCHFAPPPVRRRPQFQQGAPRFERRQVTALSSA